MQSRLGTIYAIDANGMDHTFHDFSVTDGEFPIGTLISVNGLLYGTTQVGGRYGNGTVFEVSPSGTERVLHDFRSSVSDGSQPEAGLTLLNRACYGTATGGGAFAGIVFNI